LEYKIPYVPVCLNGRRFFFKGKSTARIGKPVYIDPKVEVTYENAAAVAQDMHAQVQALFEGKTVLPVGRFEIVPEMQVAYRPVLLSPAVPQVEAALEEAPLGLVTVDQQVLDHITGRLDTDP
jgi:hypothetical protein